MKEPDQKAVSTKKSDDTLANSEKLRSEIKKRISNVASGAETDQIMKQLDSLLVMQAELHSETFSGPLPHPKHMKEYEECLPGCFDRMLTMAEKSLDSQIENNKRIIDHQINDSKRGMRYGLVALFFVIAAAAWCADINHDGVGIAIASIGIVGLVGKFITGRHSKTTKK